MAAEKSVSIGARLTHMAAINGGAAMYRFPELGVTYSRKEFDEKTDSLAAAFLSKGFGKGSHIGILAPNLPIWLLSFFAAVKIGARAVPFNAAYKAPEIAAQLKDADADCLIITDGTGAREYADALSELLPQLGEGKISAQFPCLKTVVYAGAGETPKGMLGLEELLISGKAVDSAQLSAAKAGVSPEEIAAIFYTSGSEGMAKGVMLSHKNLVNYVLFSDIYLQLNESDRVCNPLPLFHIFSITSVMGCLSSGTEMVIPTAFQPARLLDVLEKEKCTVLWAVPAILAILRQAGGPGKRDLSRMRKGVVGGSPASLDILRWGMEELHMPDLLYGWAQTENTCAGVIDYVKNAVARGKAYAGRDIPYVRFRVADAAGAPVPDGQVGELCCRGDYVMQGYYKNPAATAKAIDTEGWLHSGDLAVRDADGCYSIVGRMRDIIIRGGENIMPLEIETVLAAHPDVADAQIVGVPDEIFGEAVCAYVIPKPGVRTDETFAEKLRGYCGERLAGFKVPEYIRFTEGFPMNAAGKVMKYVLRAGF
ncbi:MAG: AMP-binding protein [Oscillospiraceae bacterium]|nr:AMP-binding protein [Oscillospiraceae bacterium]